MVNLEIYEGIKYALSKKQTLKDAMMSFYNSGYPKAEIEEAARKIQLEEYEAKYNISPVTSAPPQVQTTPVNIIPKTEKPKQGFFSRFKQQKPEEKIQEKKPEIQQFKEKLFEQKIPEQIQKPQFQSIRNIEIKPDDSFLKPRKLETTTPIKSIFAQKENKISPLVFPKKEYKIPEKPLQKISRYGEGEKPEKDWLVIFLIVFLLVLMGVLVAVFLFRQEILDFLHKLF